jgi:hypothetical protein
LSEWAANRLCEGADLGIVIRVDDVQAFKATRPTMYCPACGKRVRVGYTYKMAPGTRLALLRPHLVAAKP